MNDEKNLPPPRRRAGDGPWADTPVPAGEVASESPPPPAGQTPEPGLTWENTESQYIGELRPELPPVSLKSWSLWDPEALQPLWPVVAVLGFVAFVCWIATMGLPPERGPLKCYCALIVACVSGTLAVCMKWFSRRVFWWAMPAILFVAVALFARFDWYQSVWVNEQDPETGEYTQRPAGDDRGLTEYAGRTVRYIDTYRRWGRRLVYRELRVIPAGETLLSSCFKFEHCSEGPMSESGKPHGAWTYEERRDGYKMTHLWFWYGEEITEGDWHLRNK